MLRRRIRISSLKSTVEQAPAGERAWILVLKSLLHSLKNGISSSPSHLSLCSSQRPHRLSGPGLTWLRCSVCCVEREVFMACMWIFSTGDNGETRSMGNYWGWITRLHSGRFGESSHPVCSPPNTSLAGRGNSHHLETLLSKQQYARPWSNSPHLRMPLLGLLSSSQITSRQMQLEPQASNTWVRCWFTVPRLCICYKWKQTLSWSKENAELSTIFQRLKATIFILQKMLPSSGAGMVMMLHVSMSAQAVTASDPELGSG